MKGADTDIPLSEQTISQVGGVCVLCDMCGCSVVVCHGMCMMICLGIAKCPRTNCPIPVDQIVIIILLCVALSSLIIQ